MVVRRTPGKNIRIVNERDGDVLNIVVERISGDDDPHLHVRLEHSPGTYKVQWLVGSGFGSTATQLVLHRLSQLSIVHRNGEQMQLQVCSITPRDAEVRLVDKPRLFQFEWSDRYLARKSGNV